jgi:hypothetical protein
MTSTTSTTELIVGIGHVARVGKDTAATALCRDLGFVRLAFADQLKELALEADPLVTPAVKVVNTASGHGHLAWVVAGLGGFDAAQDTYPEVRKFLQRLGVGCRRVFGEDFWIDRLLERAAGHPRVVIPDVRFANEAAAIKARGGVVIRINRPGHVAAGHVSETELCDWDFDEEFSNVGSVAELQAAVGGYVRNLLETGNNPATRRPARKAAPSGKP